MAYCIVCKSYPTQALHVRTMTPRDHATKHECKPYQAGHSRSIIATSQVLTKTSKITKRVPADAGSYDP